MKTANPEYLNYNGPTYQGDVKVTIMLITPEMAKKMLEKNSMNRSLDAHAINRYVSDMSSEDWQALNGQTISFYRDGGLKDGQHRLTAIIKSGIPQWCIVVEGIENENVISDIGKPRNIRNIMEMSGCNTSLRSNAATGAVAFLFLLGTKDNAVSYQKRIAFANEYEDLIISNTRAANTGDPNSCACMRKAPVIAALICANKCGVSQNLILNFCQSVNSGLYNGEGETSTVFLARAINAPRKFTSKEREILFDITLAALDDYVNSRPRKKPYGHVKPHRWKRQALYEFFPNTYSPEK